MLFPTTTDLLLPFPSVNLTSSIASIERERYSPALNLTFTRTEATFYPKPDCALVTLLPLPLLLLLCLPINDESMHNRLAMAEDDAQFTFE